MRKLLSILIITFLFIPQFVHAYSNYEYYINTTMSEMGFFDVGFGESNNTYKDLFDELINYDTDLYFGIYANINRQYYNTRTENITFLITDTKPTFENGLSFVYNDRYSSRIYYFKGNNSQSYKYITYTYTNYDYDTIVQDVKTCLDDYTSCSWSTMIGNLDTSYNWTKITNFEQNLQPTTDYVNPTNLPIYSNYKLELGEPTEAQLNESFMIFYSLKVNDVDYTDYVPTYYDIYYPRSEPDEPIPDEPVDPDEPTSDFTSWIYWFSEPTDSISVLNNIYTLLFLYCFTIIILKVYSIFKIKR